MDRRAFITVMGGSILASPVVAESQQRPGKMPRVGVLAIAPVPQLVDAWQDGLRDLGYIEGKILWSTTVTRKGKTTFSPVSRPNWSASTLM